MDSLFFKEHYFKISNFFSTGSTCSQCFSLGKIHWSRFEFIALGLVLIISPSSEFRIMHHFFYGLIILQGTFRKNFKFFLNRFDWFSEFQFRHNSFKRVQIQSTRACFDHISLIRPWNHAPFFLMDSLFFKENSIKISKNFSIGSISWHPVQPIHRVSLYGALILVILEPNSYMAWAHGLLIRL